MEAQPRGSRSHLPSAPAPLGFGRTVGYESHCWGWGAACRAGQLVPPRGCGVSLGEGAESPGTASQTTPLPLWKRWSSWLFLTSSGQKKPSLGGQRLASCSSGRECVPTLPASPRGETRTAPGWMGGGALRDVWPVFAECLSCVWLLRARSPVYDGQGRLRPSLRAHEGNPSRILSCSRRRPGV